VSFAAPAGDPCVIASRTPQPGGLLASALVAGLGGADLALPWRSRRR
jgi:hypothetical protein